MATGFLGTKRLLPALTAGGHHDLAVRLFQSRKFPSWGYEVVNGANTVWERWDSYTTDHGFGGQGGDQNASMNSFSHYAFGAVMEWGFRDLVGIDTVDAGFGHIVFRPGPPSANSNPDVEPIDWAKARYDSVRGPIASHWRRDADTFELDVTVPANTRATVYLPAVLPEHVTEGGEPLSGNPHVDVRGMQGDRLVFEIGSGNYAFRSLGVGAIFP